MINCNFCGKLTNNPKFCSRSCTAKETNKTPKRIKTKKCKVCDNLIYHYQVYCSLCKKIKLRDISIRTISDYQNIRKYQINSRIRELARQVMEKENRLKICQVCGYNKHVEVCHIKAISSYTNDTLISIVNSTENLLYLCPNCHWELDNNLLK